MDALGYSSADRLTIHQITANFSWPLQQYQSQCVKRWGFAEFNKWYVSQSGRYIPGHITIRASYEAGEPVTTAFVNLMCPGLQEAEHFRPVRYPRLIAV